MLNADMTLFKDLNTTKENGESYCTFDECDEADTSDMVREYAGRC